ncbi:MAG: ornithine carbamoyltransferase [Deltaproteobacteria bacterium]|nr:ornithine carbamoyltransferase [Deltaproteobacteria bacterium]
MHLLTIKDLTSDAAQGLLGRAAALKAWKKAGIPYSPFIGRTLGLIFEKASTRTRVSFEAGMAQLGGSSIFISPKDSQMGRGEPVRDTARVLSRYVDAVVVRTFAHTIVEEFAHYSTVPVINGLTDTHHPCQVLADIMTIIERKGGYSGVKVCWIGDGNNMANSWIEAAALLGFDLTLACPDGHRPDPDFFKRATEGASSKIKVVTDPAEAATGADVLNTDVWASMGQEAEAALRKAAFAGYQINRRMLSLANKDAIVLHCLPAHRDEEITGEVMEGAQSVIWDQAENRLHIQKAIIEMLLTSC